MLIQSGNERAVAVCVRSQSELLVSVSG